MHVGIDDGWTGISMMGGQMVCGHFFYHLLGILYESLEGPLKKKKISFISLLREN